MSGFLYSILILQPLESNFCHDTIIVITTEKDMSKKEKEVTRETIISFLKASFLMGVFLPLLVIAYVFTSSPESLTTPISLIASKVISFSQFSLLYLLFCTSLTLIAALGLLIHEGKKIAILFLAGSLFTATLLNIALGYDDAVIEHTKSVINKYETLQCEDKPYMCQNKPKLDLMPKKIF